MTTPDQTALVRALENVLTAVVKGYVPRGAIVAACDAIEHATGRRPEVEKMMLERVERGGEPNQ